MHQPIRQAVPRPRQPRRRRLRAALLAGALAVAATPVATAGAADLTESFDSWPPSNWSIQNSSSPVGARAWYAGIPTTNTPDPGPFNAYNGAPNAYAAANFSSTGSLGTISSWLITPVQSELTQGDTVSFYTRRPTTPAGQQEYPDRLEVRVSRNGACSPGTLANDVGDFTTLLLSVNPTLVRGVYPDTWTRFEATIPPMAPTTGCIGFRYYVTAAGTSGVNSDYIGLDQVELRDQPDNVEPQTTIDDGPSGQTADDSPTFTYAASPSAGIGSYECRLTPDGQTPAAFTSCPTAGRSYSDLAEGEYSFEVRGVSHGGNLDPSPASQSFTVDTTAPDTTITSGPTGTIATDEVTFEYTAEPFSDVAGFECRLRSSADDDPAFGNCDTISETAYSELADGTYTFEVRAYDGVDNVEQTAASRTFTVDTTAPEATVTGGPSGTVGPGDVTFTYDGAPVEDLDRFECRLRTAADDDPVFGTCPTEGRTYGDLADGDYVFEVRAIDAVNNTQIPPASREFAVDRTAPSVTIDSGREGSSTETSASFAFTATPAEDVEAVECRLVGPTDADPAFAACADGTREYEDLAVGAYRFEVRATDAVGNVSAVASRTFTVEAPVVPEPPDDPTQPGGPGTPGTPGGPSTDTNRPPSAPPATTPSATPQVTGLRLLQSSFRAWTSGPSFGLVRDARIVSGRGTWLEFRLDRKVRMELRVSRQANRRWRPLRGKITRTVFRSTTRVPVRGRFRGTTLRPGVYRLSVTLVDTTTGGKTTELRTFRITR